MEEVAANPPDEEEDDIGPEGDGVECDALESVKAVVEVVPRDEHHDKRIGYREYKEIVVGQRLSDVAVDKRMEGPLCAACRAPGACQQVPGALKGMAVCSGVDKIIEDAQQYQNDGKCIGHYFVNLVEHGQPVKAKLQRASNIQIMPAMAAQWAYFSASLEASFAPA